MTVEDSIWGKRFEEYVFQMLSVFGFEKLSEQPIFENGSATDYALSFPKKWEEFIKPTVMLKFNNKDMLYTECKSGHTGHKLVNDIIKNKAIKSTQLLDHLDGLAKKFPKKKILYLLVTDYVKKISFTRNDKYTFFNAGELISEEHKKRTKINYDNIFVSILDPGRISMYLFKKEIFFTRRYLQELSVSNETLIGNYQEQHLTDFLKEFDCSEVDDVDGVSILVSHKESPNDKRRRYLNYFADIFIDLDKKIDDNELREIIQKSIMTLIIDFFDEELMQVPGFNYRLNLGVHVQVPFFETVHSLREGIITPIMEYQNKIMSEILPQAREKGSKANFRVLIKPEHIRIYDYESFAPGGIMCLVGHPLLFFSTKAIKRRRISKRDSNYFKRQINF